MKNWFNYNEWEDDDDWEEESGDWSFDDDTIVTIKPVDNEQCPQCQSKHCIQNYSDRFVFLCLDCFHQFRNS